MRSFFIGVLTFLSLFLAVDLKAQLCDINQLPTGLRNGLVAYYPFCGNADDLSGNNYHGQVNGPILTSDRFNNGNSSYQFDGIDDFIAITKKLPDLTTLSISLWINHTNGQKYSGIISDATGAMENDFYFNVNNSSVGVKADKNGASLDRFPLPEFNRNTPPLVTGLNFENKWSHLVLIMEPNQVKLYVNGVLVTTVNQPSSNFGFHALQASIGKISDEGYSIQYFKGGIDDFFIFNRALSECEIQQLYTATNSGINLNEIQNFNPLQDTLKLCGTVTSLNAGANYSSYRWNTGELTQIISPSIGGKYFVTVTNNLGCTATDSTYLSLVNANILQNDTTICKGSSITLSASTLNSTTSACTSTQLPANLQNGLMAYYPFCGNANDLSGNGNNGVVSGATLTKDRFGQANSAYSFNGSGNYINVPNSTSISIQNSFTISSWIYMQGGGCNPRVLEINSVLNSCGGYTLAVNGNSDISRTIHAANFGSCTNSIGFNPTQAITSLAWHHLAFTVDANTGIGNFYLDGQLIQTKTGYVAQPFSYNGNALTIGNINAGRCDWWGGMIDDVILYNRALTSNEIRSLYTSQNTITWSTGDNTNTITVSPTQSTKYYVTVSDGITSCTDSILIKVDNLTSFNPFPDTISQCGKSINLDAGGNFQTYNWSNGDTSKSITVKQSGNYQVLVKSVNGCSALDSVSLSLIDANILQSDTTICNGTSLQLYTNTIGGASGITQLWSKTYSSQVGYLREAIIDGDDLVLSGGFWPTYPNGTTDQRLLKINSNGDLLYEKVRSPGGDHDTYHSIQLLDNGNYLLFGQQNAQGTLYFDGFWTIYNKQGIELSTGFFPVAGSTSGTDVNRLPNGNFIFTGPGGGGNANGQWVALTNSNFQQIKYVNLPMSSWQGSKIGIDSISNLIYIATSESNIIKLWKFDFTLNLLASYQYTVGAGVNFENIKVINSEVFIIANELLAGTTFGRILRVDKNGALLNQLNLPTASLFTAFAIVNNKILVSVNKVAGLSPTANQLLQIDLNLNIEKTYDLAGSTFVVSDLLLKSNNIYLVGSNGSFIGAPRVDKLMFNESSRTILWSTGETSDTINVKPSISTKYFVTISDGINTCSDSIFVKVSNLSDFNPLPDTLAQCGTTISLDAGGNFQSYSWNTGNTSRNIIVTQGGKYIVNALTAEGCKAIDSTLVSIVNVNISNGDTTICSNRSISIGSSSSDLYKYLWSTGETTKSLVVSPITTTVYYLKATDGIITCTDSIKVTVELPSKGVRYPTQDIIVNRPTELAARNFGKTYLWSPDVQLNSPRIVNPIITPNKQQQYSVRITTEAGCVTVDTVLVRVFPDRNIYLPEGFTPDGDGRNDRLYPIPVGIREIRTFRIYNRWGTLLYDNRNANISTGWDGTYLGTAQPMESYVWVAEGIDIDGKFIRRTGNTILIR